MTTGWRTILGPFNRHPALHFLLLGGALFLLRTGLTVPAVPAGPAVPATSASAAAASPVARPRTQPLTDDELLYREALRLGLDRTQPVERRLIQNMRFLEVSPGASERALYRQAVNIGFNRTDPVVRRFLVAQMRLLARAGPQPDTFSPTELAAYLERHQERFALPSFVRLTHVFLSADRRGGEIEKDARRLLSRLRAERVSPEDAPALADPFLLGNHPVLSSRLDLERIYGSEMATEVMRLPVGARSGPVRSAQGLHLVWIHEIRQKEPAKLEVVRTQVALELAGERQDARLAEHLRQLRQREAQTGTPPKASSR